MNVTKYIEKILTKDEYLDFDKNGKVMKATIFVITVTIIFFAVLWAVIIISKIMQ